MNDFTISKIEPQKKSKNRYSVFTNNQFKIGVSADTLLKYNLQTGKHISSELYEQIEAAEKYTAIKDAALRYLARRPHSKKELKDKLLNKFSKTSLIDNVLQEFEGSNYLNDAEFAAVFIADQIRLKKAGPLLIKSKLLQKGVNPEIADSIFATEYPESLQLENCTILAQKKIKSVNPTLSQKEQKNKVANYLKQKGYHWEIIKPVLDSILSGEENYE